MIPFKDILLEAMRPAVATATFAKYGVKNAAHLDKGALRKYYMALVKKHHSDVGGNDEDMKWINAAYEVLKQYAKDVPDVELKDEEKTVNIEFRNVADNELMDSGKCNHMEYTEIIQKLREHCPSFTIRPLPNYDRIRETWLTSTITISTDSDFFTAAPYIESLYKH